MGWLSDWGEGYAERLDEPSRADYEAAMEALALRLNGDTRQMMFEMAKLFRTHRLMSLAALRAGQLASDAEPR